MPEGDGRRERRARTGTQVPPTSGDRAPGPRGAGPGPRSTGRGTRSRIRATGQGSLRQRRGSRPATDAARTGKAAGARDPRRTGRSEEGHRAAREDHPAKGAGTAGPGRKTAEARGGARGDGGPALRARSRRVNRLSPQKESGQITTERRLNRSERNPL